MKEVIKKIFFCIFISIISLIVTIGLVYIIVILPIQLNSKSNTGETVIISSGYRINNE